MIEYIVPTNIDDRILRRAAEVMKNGGLVAHPTDTSWHISCAYSSGPGFSRLKTLKDGARGYLFTLFASDISLVSDIAAISTSQYRLMRRMTPGPYVFILDSLRSLEKQIGEKRRKIGIRIPGDPVSRAILETIGEPMFSTTAARTMDDPGWWDTSFADENLFEMGWELEGISGIDMILDGGEALSKTLSTVLDLSGEEVVVIRQGIGEYHS
jgi:tRNA threonylcarbamoyl adenosine modification protein (Sua5/YciO/YrdC/YwlC family)